MGRGPGLGRRLGLTDRRPTLWANVVCLPIADKLAFRAGEEKLLNDLVLQGVLGIAREDSPLVLKAKLASFLTHGKSQELTS